MWLMAGEAKNFSYTRSALDSMVETMPGWFDGKRTFWTMEGCAFFFSSSRAQRRKTMENQKENLRCWPYSSQMRTSHICLSINFQSIPHIAVPPRSSWNHPEISLFGFQTHPIRCRGGAVDMTSSRTTRRSSLSLTPLQKILALALGF